MTGPTGGPDSDDQVIAREHGLRLWETETGRYRLGNYNDEDNHYYVNEADLRGFLDALEEYEAEPDTTPAERLEASCLMSTSNDYSDRADGEVRVEHESFYGSELRSISESEEWEFVGAGEGYVRVREVTDE